MIPTDFIRELDIESLVALFAPKTSSQLEQELRAFMDKCRRLNTHLMFVTPYIKNLPEIVSVQKRDPFTERWPDPSKRMFQYFQQERPVLIFDWKGMEEFPTREQPRGTE